VEKLLDLRALSEPACKLIDAVKEAVGAQGVGEHSVLRFIAFMNGNADTQGKATV
jgi:hypothetical protein